jgi:ABC-type amino acid transport substrate-binding protein
VSNFSSNEETILNRHAGRIDASVFDRMSAEWRSEQGRLLRSIQEHESASTAFEADGVRLLELSSKAQRTVRDAGTRRETQII